MCPPGVDQTTRTAQIWQVLAPEKRQALPFQERRFFHSGVEEESVEKFQEILWGMLARPAHSYSPGSGLPARVKQGQSCGYFGLLSNEIFDIVFKHLESKRDIVTLGLASTSLWRLVLHNIQSKYLAAAAPWADTRLLYQGSYSVDLPDALLDDGDLVKTLVGPNPYQRRYDRRPYGRVFFGAVAETARSPTVGEVIADYKAAMEFHRESSHVGEQEWDVLMRDIAYPEYEKDENEWVLRNLTTRQIVCSDIVTKEDAAMSLEVVLVTQMRWTSMLRDNWEDLAAWRGKWAGHRFDIVTKGIHEKEGGNWEDLSIELTKSLDRS